MRTGARALKPKNTDISKERHSLGIACCRINNNRPEILLICKRFTYAFHMFVCGRYNPNNNSELINLFSGMTIEEKYDILSLNFMVIWYRTWLDIVQRSSNFFQAKNKFESTFLIDGGIRLKKLMTKSKHAKKMWEIPKGRKKNKSELDIHCAIREFHEETGTPKKNYKILPWAKRTASYVDDGIKYTNTYYIAFTKYIIEPRIDFAAPVQTEEVSDIRWMNIDDIKLIDETGRLEYFIRPIFNFIKKYAKQS